MFILFSEVGVSGEAQRYGQIETNSCSITTRYGRVIQAGSKKFVKCYVTKDIIYKKDYTDVKKIL